MFIESNSQKKSYYESLQTPSFIIRVNKFDGLIEDIFEATNLLFPESIIGYSFKTNNLPWIISHAKEKGLWAEVVSSDEYTLARNLGYESNNIIFNGPVKGKTEFIEAVENGSIVNLDSHRELEWLNDCSEDLLKNSHLGLRVNFCIEEKCPGESQCGADDGRFGFSYEQGDLEAAILFLKNNNIPLSGLHLHVSSKTRGLNIYRAIAETIVEIVNKYNLNLEFIDIGGGYFGGVPGKPSFKEYFKLIKGIFERTQLLNETRLIVEPGMSLIGASVDYLTSVIDTKKTKNNRFVQLDGSRIHIDPLMKKSGYVYKLIPEKNVSPESVEQILCGFTCMEDDRFFRLSVDQLECGNNVLFEKVGAYTMGQSPQFIEAYPAVYIEQNGEYNLVRAKQELPTK